MFPVRQKVPIKRTRWKQLQIYRPTESHTDKMFRDADADGIGCITGSASRGLVVRDFDDPNHYADWRESHKELSIRLPTARTVRGFHVYARADSPGYAKYDDGELIGDNKHYVVVPPSLHPRGTEYAWIDGPPLGPSEFPTIDPVSAGFVKTKSSIPSEVVSQTPVVSNSAELDHEIREAIYRTRPDRPGQRHNRVFQFARTLRDLLPENPTAGILRNAIERWWSHAAPYCSTTEFRVTWDDFRRAWSSVLVPMSESIPAKLLTLGSKESLQTTSFKFESEWDICSFGVPVFVPDPQQRLVGACAKLAQSTPDNAFYLSTRTAARVVGVTKSRAHRMIKRLVRDGVLVVVKQGKPSPTYRRGTTVYRMGAGHAKETSSQESVHRTSVEGQSERDVGTPSGRRTVPQEGQKEEGSS